MPRNTIAARLETRERRIAKELAQLALEEAATLARKRALSDEAASLEVLLGASATRRNAGSGDPRATVAEPVSP